MNGLHKIDETSKSSQKAATMMIRTAQRLIRQQVRCFAAQAASPQERRIKLPPNLKIDPRAKLSPLSPFVSTKIERPEKTKNEVKKQLKGQGGKQVSELSKKEERMTEEEDDDKEAETDDGDSEEEEDDDSIDAQTEDEEYWFEPAEPLYATPLPERLTVQVVDKSDFTSPVRHLTLSEILFGRDPVRVDMLQRVVQYQRNKKRGKRKAKTKTISEVSGSGKKMRNQKGGGVARAGHKRPPHWRGGARAHGPKGSIQDYTTKLNKRVRKLGLLHALSQKLKEGNLIVVNDLFLETHKTKDFVASLSMAGLAGKTGSSTYVVDWAEEEEGRVLKHLPLHLAVATRNIPRIKVSGQNFINVYDILKHEKLILTVGAIQALEERLQNATY
jgi:large subunit ribosomal protein L4